VLDLQSFSNRKNPALKGCYAAFCAGWQKEFPQKKQPIWLFFLLVIPIGFEPTACGLGK